jgi:N,N-dimethylformamidase beta subunit-like, C-terminal
VQPLLPDGGSSSADATPPEEGRLDRRKFLQVSAFGAAGAVIAAQTPKKPPGRRGPARPRRPDKKKPPAVVNKKLASGVVIPTATWIIAENAKAGTLDWVCSHNQPDHTLEGFASQVSAVHGDDVTLFVNTTAQAVQVQAYRMGYYQGLGGRLVWQSDMVNAGAQPFPVVSLGIGTVSCPWSPTMTISITKEWPPGCYLLKLVGNGGQEQFVPLTVRDDSSKAAYVIQNSVTTWQAYNLYGEYSLYYGPTGNGGKNFANRARAVSFDRPYPQTWASGAADFVGNEFPLVFQLERLGADITYWTDVDLHTQPQLLANHRCLFSMGHDEYWSTPMREATALGVAGGVNVAFLGANACYRQIRLQPTSVGPNRLQVCYKDATEDPIAAEQPALTTVNWDQAPVNNPESTLIGSMYQSVGARADLTVTDASTWFWNGCNLEDGHTFPNTIFGEYDRYVPAMPGPANVDVVAHSAVPGQFNWSDMTYYTAPGNGGGVFASGSASFVSLLSTTGVIYPNVVPGPFPGVTDEINRAMENLYSRFGLGPAGSSGPSGGSWADVYTGSSAAAGSAATTNSA